MTPVEPGTTQQAAAPTVTPVNSGSDLSTGAASVSGVFVIEFLEPTNGVAGWATWMRDGALGLAWNIAAAARFDTEEIAVSTLQNSYGPYMREIGSVKEVAP